MSEVENGAEQIAALESLPDIIELIAAKKKRGHPYLGCFIRGTEYELSFDTPDPIKVLARRVRKERCSILCLEHRNGAVFVFEEPGFFVKGSKSGWDWEHDLKTGAFEEPGVFVAGSKSGWATQ